jgi:hypothetical protein
VEDEGSDATEKSGGSNSGRHSCLGQPPGDCAPSREWVGALHGEKPEFNRFVVQSFVQLGMLYMQLQEL